MLHIVTDSCCDLSREYIDDNHIHVVPLTVMIDDKEYLDGVDIEPLDFYHRMAEARHLPKTAQPSPAAFAKVFEELSAPGDEILCLTISAKLSGTYQSATIAREMTGARVSVFDTKAATLGQGLQVMKAAQLAGQGYSASAAVEELTSFRDAQNILVMFDTLDNIIKGGRLGRTQGLFAKIANIKVILQAEEGEVVPLEKVRGKQRFLTRPLEIMGERVQDFSDRIVAISHVDNPQDVDYFAEEIRRRYNPKDIIINLAGPVISTYAGKGGVIISF